MTFTEEFPMRRKKDQVTDEKEILAIIEKADYIHWGLHDRCSPYPYVVTTDYGYEYLDGVLTFYIHGAPAGRKIELLRENPHVGFNLETATSLWSPKERSCHFTTNYQSIVGTAIAEILVDPQEKAHGLTLLINRVTAETFTDDEYSAEDLAYVQVIKFTVQHLSGKKHFKAAD